MDSSRPPGKTRKDKERQKAVTIYCMYCREPMPYRELAIHEGRYDVCRKLECLGFYYKEREVKLKRSIQQQKKRQLEENYPDPTWMTGEGN